MRKILYYVSLFLTLCLLASCRGMPGLDGMDGLPGRDGRDGRDGIDGRDGVASIIVKEVVIPQDSWCYSDIDDNNFFFYTFNNVKDLTKDVYDNGLLKMYRYITTDNKEVQMEMPYVRLSEQYVPSIKDWVFYTETVDYDFSKDGDLTIYYAASDFDYELDEAFIPESMRFRLVIMR